MGASILVVEAEPDISALVAYHLAREAYRERTAADGQETLEAIRRERPDLVVLDLCSPGPRASRCSEASAAPRGSRGSR